MTITFPKYSFVQLSAAPAVGCSADPALCLPLSSPEHLAFQATFHDLPPVPSDISYDVTSFYATHVANDGTVYPFFGTSDPYWLSVHYADLIGASCAYSYTEGSGTSWDVNYGYYPFASFADYNTAAQAATLYTESDGTRVYSSQLPLGVGDCFRLLFIADYSHVTYTSGIFTYTLKYRQILGTSDCLVRTPADQCYTSLLQYSNPSNVFDFSYIIDPTIGVGGCPAFVNKVELPMYLRDPKMENDQKVYTRSDGSLVKLYERKEEIYTLETDLLPYSWHKALDIALSHDSVIITSPNALDFDPVNTATQFVKKENYEIEYQKAPLSSFGKGSCKLSNATPIHLINNNCG